MGFVVERKRLLWVVVEMYDVFHIHVDDHLHFECEKPLHFGIYHHLVTQHS